MEQSNAERERLWRVVREVSRKVLDAVAAPRPESYLVGGVVRDLLTGWTHDLPDIDYTVVGDGVEYARAFVNRFGGSLQIHPRFGTAKVTGLAACGEPVTVDFVTARREVYRHPGALPDVVPGALADDLFRRDFSLNALAVASDHCREGSLEEIQDVLEDPVGGFEDLERRLVRILHARSFLDDPTRLLRAVRYAIRFECRIEEETATRFAEALEQGALNAVSAIRLVGELRRVFEEPRPDLVVRELMIRGVWSFYDALGFAADDSFLAALRRLGEQWSHTARGFRSAVALRILAHRNGEAFFDGLRRVGTSRAERNAIRSDLCEASAWEAGKGEPRSLHAIALLLCIENDQARHGELEAELRRRWAPVE